MPLLKLMVQKLKNLQYRHTNWKKSLQKIINAILSIADVSRTTISDCLSWPEALKRQCADEFSWARELIIENKNFYMKAGGKGNPQLRRDLSKDIPDLENLMDILDNVGLNSIEKDSMPY